MNVFTKKQVDIKRFHFQYFYALSLSLSSPVSLSSSLPPPSSPCLSRPPFKTIRPKVTLCSWQDVKTQALINLKMKNTRHLIDRIY